MEVEDNSDDFMINFSEDEIFKIGSNDINGTNLMKTFFSLGNRMEILTNDKSNSTKFILDLSQFGDELMYQKYDYIYNDKIEDGIFIKITDLDDKIKEKISENSFNANFISKLSRMYCKYIEQGLLKLSVNSIELIPNFIDEKLVVQDIIMNDYEVKIYKSKSKSDSGIEIFIGNDMVYDKESGKKEIRWSSLNQPKYSFSKCIVEVNYNGYKEKYDENKAVFYDELIKFIKDNKDSFKSNTITIQYEMDVSKVEELKEYYGENTAKAIGMKSFNKLYEEYSYRNKKRYNK
ncbi:hypothetical protein [Romboutsia ilealis]|uniref:hypothetical protein n=1 Tax=Romboutsia ilealis TaxID=1115758 RepID=UPI002573EE91|nr:hypothetical protein [Romboutsia ilealis]